MRQDLLSHRIAAVRHLCGQQVIQRAAQTVDIGSTIRTSCIERLLGRHEIQRSHHLAGVRQRVFALCRVIHTSQSHVQHLDHALRIHQDVRRLDVAVDDTMLVRVLQPLRRLCDVVHGRGDGQWALLLDQRCQVLAFDTFHHQEMDAPRIIRIIRPDDVRVREFGRRLRLAVKSFHRFGMLHSRGGQHFERHYPFHTAMLCFENLPHAAAA